MNSEITLEINSYKHNILRYEYGFYRNIDWGKVMECTIDIDNFEAGYYGYVAGKENTGYYK